MVEQSESVRLRDDEADEIPKNKTHNLYIYHSQAGHMAYLLLVCWQPAVKSRGKGRGGCLVLTPPASQTEFSVLNNLYIDGVSGYFAQLFNLV